MFWMEERKIKVLLVQTMRKPKEVEIRDELNAMQELVGGYIQEYFPFDEEVALICNEEGKMMGLPPNRAIYDENGQVMDVIAGDFFLCLAPVTSENFESLSPELLEKYKEKFRYPERFFRTEEGVKIVTVKPREAEMER